MKNVKILLSAVLAVAAATATAQDFSDPKYAKWGDTPEERQENILSSNFLKESCDNKDYNAAAGYLQKLIAGCPGASENTYARGATIYKNKITKAQGEEKEMYIDSLLLMYDLRLEYFGNHATRGKAYILDRKAREFLIYRSADREGLRNIFKEAIAAAGDKAESDLVILYFSNLCDDYQNDEVMADEVISEYDRLTPMVAGNEDAKKQIDALLAKSEAAGCDNLERLFAGRLEADPTDEALLKQAVTLMSRARCTSDFFYRTAEQYYEVKPSAETAMMLAQGFQDKGDFDKAIKYLRETLAVEEDPAQQEALLVRISVVEMAAHHYGQAAEAARQARDLNPENGYAYFVLAQCYAASAAGCPGIAGQAAYWAAYDTMNQAIARLDGEPDTLENAKKMAGAYRNAFPSSEECFFNELSEGARYTVTCGSAAGVVTTVRYR